MKFKKSEKWLDKEDGHIWTVGYEGLSCTGNHNVTFNRPGWGRTMSTLDAYIALASGRLVKQNEQLELFLNKPCSI